MKKVGQLMHDMGFNKNGSDSAKEAFIKFLIKQSTGVSVQTPTEKRIIQDNPQKILNFPTQLTFNFVDEETTTLKKA